MENKIKLKLGCLYKFRACDLGNPKLLFNNILKEYSEDEGKIWGNIFDIFYLVKSYQMRVKREIQIYCRNVNFKIKTSL